MGQSVALHPKAKTEDEVQIDTTVQEKNITFPTDSKLAKKVIDNCAKIAEKEGVAQRQSYKRVSKQLLREAYFGHHPRRQKWQGKNSGQLAKEYFGNWKENYPKAL